eukprot:gene410-6823_t
MSFLHQHSSTNKTITWLKYLKQFLPSEKKLNSDFIIHTFTVENNNITTGCFKECRDTLIHHTKFLNKYFSSIQIIITPLSAQENTYPKAPFHMMRKIMTNETFQDTYTHFMMIEHDTFPIRNFWAQQAEHLVYNSLSNFNVFGSAVRCFSCNVASYDMFQLNGNSIYSLQNKNYIQFFDKSQFLFGYDVEIYHKTLLELPWKNHQSLTIFSLFLQNSYIDQIDEIEFPKQYPETYFIHSKAKFNATKFQKDDHFFKPNKNQVKIVFFVMDMNIEILKNLIKYTPCGKRQMNVDLWISSKCNGLCKSLQKIQNCFGDVILRQVEKEFEDPYKNTFHQFMYNREINETYTHAFIYSDKIKPVQKFWLQKLVLLVENVSPSVGMIIPGKRDHSCNLPLVHFSRHGIFKIEKLEEYFSIIVPQDPVFGRFYNSTKLSDDSTTEQKLQSKKNTPVQKKKENRIISFGLYGNLPKYTFGAIRNVELQKQIFPDWKCRFYVDETVPKNIIDQLKVSGAEIVEVDSKLYNGTIRGMFWRFFVSADPTVDRFIIRDTDSRLNLREKFAIDEWIKSKKGVHSMRDHFEHNFPFNGMWGAVKGAVPNLMELSKNYVREKYFADMNLLAEKVYPLVKNNMISHDSYHCKKWGAKPFPTRRFAKEHVGGVFDENDNPRVGDMLVMKPTPVECRAHPIFENALLLGVFNYFMASKENTTQTQFKECPKPIVCPKTPNCLKTICPKIPVCSKSTSLEKITKQDVEPKKSLRKPWKKVISFGLYGSGYKYTLGMIHNCALAKAIYPGWIVKVYHDKTVPANIIKILRAFDNVEVVEIKNPKLLQGGIRGMFWRFLTFEKKVLIFLKLDPEVDVMIVRDSDSRLSNREKEAVDDWLKSGKGFHIIRDNPHHAIAILGGTWGARRGVLPIMLPIMENYPKNEMQQDQDNQISHDAYNCKMFPNSKPFPSARKPPYSFVGSVVQATGEIMAYSPTESAYFAPVECRPNKDAIIG